MSVLTAYNALNKKIACYARVPGSPAIKATFGVRECSRVSRGREATREYFASFEILELILCERWPYRRRSDSRSLSRRERVIICTSPIYIHYDLRRRNKSYVIFAPLVHRVNLVHQDQWVIMLCAIRTLKYQMVIFLDNNTFLFKKDNLSSFLFFHWYDFK